MIKAIIADVDGVMVGKKEGFNFPLPHDSIIEALRKISDKGISVILCTAKFHVAIDEIIQQAQLSNPHITDAGALITDPLGEKKILKQKTIPKATIAQHLLRTDVYTELYAANEYFVRADADPVFMAKRTKLLQMKPRLVDSLEAVNQSQDIIKVISYADSEATAPELEKEVQQLGQAISYIWSHHPFIMPKRPLVITAAGVSKEGAAKEVMQHLGISFQEVLGIGDSPADWGFMQLCGFSGVVGDNPRLIEHIQSSTNPYYIADSVDNHGILEIFDHFGLLRSKHLQD